MSVTLYTISLKSTSNVLAFCTFEKRSLIDQAAWDKLRDDLVGDALPIGLSSNREIQIRAPFLGVDAIAEPVPSDMSNPYLFQLHLSAPTAIAGDGTEKTLASVPASANVTSIDVKTTAAVVTLDFTPPDLPLARLVIDKNDPIDGFVVDKTAKTLTFGIPAALTLTVGQSVDVIFMMTGVRVSHFANQVT